MFGGQLLLYFVQVSRRPHFYEIANVILVHRGQDSMTMPRLGVWVCDLTILPVEIDYVVDETEGDVEYSGDLSHCLPFVVELDDPLSQVRGICGDHGGTGVKVCM